MELLGILCQMLFYILTLNFLVEDCKALFKNIKYRQYKASHDVLLSPSDNGANISYKDVLRFLLDD